MIKKLSTTLLFLSILSFVITSCTLKTNNSEFSPSNTLWYNSPAKTWNEALPIGNGRLGAMIFGGVENETIQFNEETLWTGQPHNYAHEGANRYFLTLRKLLWEGKQSEAEKLANKYFMSEPLGQLSYQPFGSILLHFANQKNITHYKRTLNLSNATASVFYEADGIKYKREIFSSAPDQTIGVKIEADKPGLLDFAAELKCPHSNYSVTIKGNEIILKGKADDYRANNRRKNIVYPKSELWFEARLKVEVDGGRLINNGKTIQIENANSATLYLVAATSFVNYKNISGDPEKRCKEYLSEIKGKTFEQIKLAHVTDYQKFYNRVKLNLGKTELSMRPTNKRIESFKTDEDPNMVALLYNFGRYLLISSSRPGTQPANLQGIWNAKLAPEWDSKYTININTEMNYWPAEISNLPEMVEPLIDLIDDLSNTGKGVAREHYNLDGWVAHHNTDLWRGAAPINNSNHGIWPVGGAWLSQNIWWHYQFSGDKEFLRNKAYPILKEASRFFVGYLVPDPENPQWLISGPSNSPEHGGLVMGPTMDHQIIRNLFASTIEAAEVLGVDTDFVAILKAKRAKIAPNQIGKYGQLQEWLQDIDNPNDRHRHVSHLWGLHPGNEIHPLTTPKLADACRETLAERGDKGTGWSRAWKINFWARLLDGDHAFLILKNLIVPAVTNEANIMTVGGGLYNNLFDAHPPFQIDGNFGVASGITEMLLQSHLRTKNRGFYQDILPALPSAIASGEISGIRGRGGFEFDIVWKNRSLVSVKVKSTLGNNLNLRYNGKTISKNTLKGDVYTFSPNDFNLTQPK